MILLIGGEKGGTGKTTIATNVAAMMINRNKNVLLVDTDKQESSSSWCAERQDNPLVKRIPCVQKFGKGLSREIEELSKYYSDIIIDAGGRENDELRLAMGVADKMYVPLKATQFDIWTINNLDKLVNEMKIVNRDLEVYIVMNMASTHPSISAYKKVLTIIEDIPNLKVLTNPIHERISYIKAAQKGLCVHELDKPDLKAIEEINYLYNEMVK